MQKNLSLKVSIYLSWILSKSFNICRGESEDVYSPQMAMNDPIAH